MIEHDNHIPLLILYRVSYVGFPTQNKTKPKELGGIQMINRVIVHEHKVIMGENVDEHEKFRNGIIERIFNVLGDSLDIQKIYVYNLNGEFCDFRAGNEERIVIYGNASRKGAGEELITLDEPLKINGIENDFTTFLQPNGAGVVITSENGIALAEYFRDTNELFILFNLFKKYDANVLAIFEYILKQWDELVWKRIELESSWAHTSNKEKLVKQFKKQMIKQKKQQIEQDREQAKRYEDAIDEYKRKIKQLYDNLIRLRNQIETEEKNLENINQKLIADLDLIVQHPKVSDLHIKDNEFIVYVPNVYAYDDDDNRYYIGNCRIEINLYNADVRFFGDNPRKSYWTSHDPHPHVNGSDGTACLGNVSSTIAELASRNEIYALTLVCIDFLESVNTEDAAGRNIRNWDMVDEEGNIIRYGGEPDEGQVMCYECEEYFDEEDTEYAYGYVDEDGEGIDGRHVCQDCVSEYYYYDDEYEVYVRG